MSDAAKKKAKQRRAIEKLKLDNARQLRGIFFIEPEDAEFKPLVESWKFRCQERCLAKYRKRTVEKPTAVLANTRRRPRLDGAGHKPHQDHITEKRDEVSESLKSCSQTHSDASSNENSGCKGSSGKIMRKLEKIPAWQLKKNKKEVINEARNKGRKVHFASLMDLCHLKNSELELRHQKY